MKKHVDNPVGDIETIIGHDTTITGEIQGSGNLRIDGRIDGGINVSSDIVIGESGSVQGNIKANSLIVAGSVTGNVDCDGNLSIHATGQLVGDVRVRSLNIADGGIFKGRSEMDTRLGEDLHGASLFSPAH
ncbi:MAG: polymer-forming cytoskeletal protein [Schwartzia sp.]|nr:polymer-forming cytoskeletal protein [Schwartzia sp. (in: firmicutes)]